MSLEGLDLNLLVALDALLSEKNVTRAAERTYVSQPAMSASLQKLRLYLDDPLLERVGRSLELTPRAQLLAEPIKDFLHRVRMLVDGETAFDPATAKRTFRLAMTSYCTELIGTALVQHIARIAPGISCQLDELTIDILDRVAQGQVDVCIAHGLHSALTATGDQGEACQQHVFSDEFVLVGAGDNPLLEHPIDYATFCAQQYIEIRLDRSMLTIIERTLGQRDVRPHVAAWVPSFQHAMSTISGTSMIAIIPSRLVALRGDSFGLRAVRSPLPLDTLNETAFWHPRHENDLGHRWLREQIAHVAAGLPSALSPSA